MRKRMTKAKTLVRISLFCARHLPAASFIDLEGKVRVAMSWQMRHTSINYKMLLSSTVRQYMRPGLLGIAREDGMWPAHPAPSKRVSRGTSSKSRSTRPADSDALSKRSLFLLLRSGLEWRKGRRNGGVRRNLKTRSTCGILRRADRQSSALNALASNGVMTRAVLNMIHI